MANENVIHHGVLFIQDERRANILAIDLGDILCVYVKGEMTQESRRRSGCFIQFFDSEGIFFREEDEPTQKYNPKDKDEKPHFKGSIAIVEIECPALSMDDVCRAMMDTRQSSFGWASYFTYRSISTKKVSNGPSYR